MPRKRSVETENSASSAGAAPAVKPKRRRKAAAGAEPQTVADFLAEFTPSEREEVARLAYSYWEQRGRQHGSPDEDWYRAEEEVRRQRAASAQTKSRR